MVKLIIEDDEGKTTVVPLIRDEITIGRKEGNTIRLTERNVSRRHAKLLKVNGAIFIEDLTSYNGIKVNGNKVNGRIAITEGDRVQIGDYILGLKIEAANARENDEYESAQTMEIQRIPDSELPAEEGTPAGKAPPPAPTPASQDKPASGEATDQYGRLVCVSSNFQAKEWLLDKSTMVLGRTDDNDIVINHRSISRHHARITSEGNRYTIRDLESANGVRINGEEYGKVELRRGDHVDLGHVRLRFVAPAEDFVFKRDATVVDISKPGSGRGLLWALLSGAVVLVVGLVIWHFTTTPDPTPRPGPTPPDNALVKPLTPDVGAPAVAVPGSVDAGAATMAPDQLIARIKNFMATEAWDDAIKDCGKLTEEQLKGAAEVCKKVEEEKAAYDLFEKFNSAATQNKYLDAVRFHNEIPQGSVYKTRDLKIYNDAKSKYLAGANKRLDDHVTRRECDKAQAEAELIKQVVPADTQAEAKVKQCNQAVVAVKAPTVPVVKKPRPVVKRPRPVVKKPVVKKPIPDKPVSTAPTLADLQKAKGLLQQARETFVHGKYARSMSLARSVLELNPGDQMAIQIIGASACYLKNAKNAKWAFRKLKAVQRNYLRTICQRNGVTLE